MAGARVSDRARASYSPVSCLRQVPSSRSEIHAKVFKFAAKGPACEQFEMLVQELVYGVNLRSGKRPQDLFR